MAWYSLTIWINGEWTLAKEGRMSKSAAMGMLNQFGQQYQTRLWRGSKRQTIVGETVEPQHFAPVGRPTAAEFQAERVFLDALLGPYLEAVTMSKPANSVLERHTPGPWEVIPVPKRSRQEVRAVDGPLIGEVYGVEDEDNKANARLIAAAPELLNALRELTRWVDIAIVPNYTARRPMPEMGEKAMEVARALIRKTEGGA